MVTICKFIFYFVLIIFYGLLITFYAIIFFLLETVVRIVKIVYYKISLLN